MSPQPKDLTGRRYGHLVVRGMTYRGEATFNRWYAEVECDCGVVKLVRSTSLYSGDTGSCGCQMYNRKPSDGMPVGERCYANGCREPNNGKRYCSEACRQTMLARTYELTKMRAERREAARPKPSLPAGCAPENAIGDRRDDCAQYGHCLGHASALNWPGFRCGACPGYVPGETRAEMLIKLCGSRVGDAVIHLERD